MRAPLPTPADRKAYERDGFVLLRAAFPREDIARIGAWTDEISARPEESGRARR